MNTKDTGGPAFPCHPEIVPHKERDFAGMTLRDYFMAHAPAEPQPWFIPEMPPEPDPGMFFDEHSAWVAEQYKQRYVQWPAAWAGEMLKARDREGGHADIKPEIDPILLRSIEHYCLELPTRAYRLLQEHGVKYIGDLVQLTENELRHIRGLGKHSVSGIKEALAIHGLALGTKLENWSPSEAEIIAHAAAPELITELKAAHQIIRNALNIMTLEQKLEWAARNEKDGVTGDGDTRANERESAIEKSTGEPQ